MADKGGKPVIAVDAMGGDHGPGVVVPGAVNALRDQQNFTLALYGDEAAVRAQIATLATDDLSLKVVSCNQDIEMSESPAAAIRGKPDSPIVRAMQDQKNGEVHAVVSAGSTGAMVAASLLILGRLPSVDRPAIATLVPTVTSHLLLVDAGANVQCTPEHLLSFAQMGDLFAREILDLPEPGVGLLNIGGEESKGRELEVATFQLFQKAAFRFTGNVESNQLLLGIADVVVTDGYTGNMVLKLVEGFGRYMAGLARNEELSASEQQALLPVLKILEQRFSYENYGGALLLGIEGVSIICHGRSSRRAITNAVLMALSQVRLDIPHKLQSVLGDQT